MLRRTAPAFKVANRCFSTEPAKVTIARNILLMHNISEAKDEAALAKLTLPAVDGANLPAELQDLTGYFQLSNVASSEKFTADPKAWQNMDFWDFAANESQRDETWPFLVGFAVVLGLTYVLNSKLPEEGKKNSNYAQLVEKLKNGDKHAAHGHAAHH